MNEAELTERISYFDRTDTAATRVALELARRGLNVSIEESAQSSSQYVTITVQVGEVWDTESAKARFANHSNKCATPEFDFLLDDDFMPSERWIHNAADALVTELAEIVANV